MHADVCVCALCREARQAQTNCSCWYDGLLIGCICSVQTYMHSIRIGVRVCTQILIHRIEELKYPIRY